MTRVQLYVYDLSKGLASQLSLSLIGKQIDGIWHTSVVVFDREIFYGRGIQITTPGASHHGQPLQVLDMGETSLDEDTLDEYLMEMGTHYTVEKYHLLDFNCNSFTSDCVGFLTGGTIPPWIEDLPSDFLSTDFGRALRPMIDRMHPVPTTELDMSPNRNTSPVAASSSRSVQEGSIVSPILRPGPPDPVLSSVVSPIHVSTNPASFHSILASHRAVVAFFTSATCGPCRFIEPTFEEIAEQKTRGTGPGLIAFVKVDIQVGAGYQLASQYSVTATPTFITFTDQQKKHEIRGVNASDLRMHVDMLLFETFPPHPHLSLSLPRLEEISTAPIVFRATSSVDVVVTKLSRFIDSSQLPEEEKINTKNTVGATILPFLKLQTPSTGKSPIKALSSLSPMLTEWSDSSKLLISALPIEQLFPIVDLWRMGFLNATVGTWVSEDVSTPGTIISEFLKKTELKPLPRSFVLTLLKCFSNALSALPLSQRLLAPGPLREKLTDFATSQLLEKDDQIRAAAASMIFNIASYTQVQRVEAGKNDFVPRVPANFDAEWEMEVVSAVIEGVRREENEEILHRLVASLGFLLRSSPAYESQLSQLLEVFQVRKLLEEKASSVARKDNVVGLTLEVCGKLCP